MDNAAAVNQQIDDEIMSLYSRGYEFPDSYGKHYNLHPLH